MGSINFIIKPIQNFEGMERDWIKIFTSPERMSIEIVKNHLIHEGIQVVELNRKDSAYQYGAFELYIHSSHFASAIEVISMIDLT